MRFRRKLIWAAIVSAILVAGVVVIQNGTIPVAERLRILERHSRRSDHAAVISLADQLKTSGELTDRAAILAAESSVETGELDRAIEFYNTIDSGADQYVTAHLALADLHRGRGQASLAEAAYDDVLLHESDNPTAHSRLALLKMVTGRATSAVKHLRKLLQLKSITGMELGWLAFPDRGVNADEYLKLCRQNEPADSAPILGLAAAEFGRGRYQECEALLAKIPNQSPLLLQKRNLKLQVELQTRSKPTVPPDAADRFRRSHECGDYVGLYALGALFEANDELQNASLCFARCLQLSDYLPAMQRLVTLLATDDSGTFGDDLDVVAMRNRVEALSRLQALVNSMRPDRVTADTVTGIAAAMKELDRHLEASAWAALAQQSPGQVSLTANGSTDIRKTIELCIVRVPRLSTSRTSDQGDVEIVADAPAVSLMDEAEARGIDFTYFESPDPVTPGRRMIEFTGGGVGVLDLDNDTWPDLHFTQGADWSMGPMATSGMRLDRIYRNLRGEQFEDVTSACGLLENRFSQGIACGDFDNDGFTDVVVANIGHNTYWMNQGDGTFRQLDGAAISSDVWTSSCAIADINQDGAADIIEVNYVRGDSFDSLICETPAGPRVCPPRVFEPTNDRILLNNGDGSFTDISEHAGITTAGAGLGVVVANLDDDPQLEIFVANDGMPNALWDNTSSPGEPPVFDDVAVARGVAFGHDGQAQACMGVSTGDFDGDGTTDLFVTNYFNEPNALYLFNEEGLAMDAAMRTNLGQASISLLGFGTQSLDANNDGRLDLFVVNGDLDDFSHEHRDFRMRPQLMFNGPTEFIEQQSLNSKDIRTQTFRGRGMARCDWNRDLRWDMVVSRLDDPVMLLTFTNREQTPKSAHVKLIGTTFTRDPIGATLCHAGKPKDVPNRRQIQLTAGSGYMASNETSIIVSHAGPMNLHWRAGSGDPVEIKLLNAAGQVIVEGRDATYRLPR